MDWFPIVQGWRGRGRVDGSGPRWYVGGMNRRVESCAVAVHHGPFSLALACAVACAGCLFDPNPPSAASDSDGASGTSATEPATSTAVSTDNAPTTGAGGQPVGCTEPPFDLPDGLVAVEYSASVIAQSGVPPFQWHADGLPPGLELVAGEPDGSVAEVHGKPTATGVFPVQLTVTDGAGVERSVDCGSITITEALRLDTSALLQHYPDGCISGPAVSFDDLVAMGILKGSDGTPPTCGLVPEMGSGLRDFDDDPNTPFSLPPGVSVDAFDCKVHGVPDPTLRYGVYAWITTVRQSGVDVFVPYCVAQPVQAGTAYGIVRRDGGVDRTLVPAHVVLGADAIELNYGTEDPDPQVTVTYTEDCAGSCFYAYFFAFGGVSGNASVSANPAAKFPASGFDGFTHAIRLTEYSPLLDKFRGRAFVAYITYDYCMAQNDQDCGNSVADINTKVALIRANGGGSNYEFALIVLPE